MRKMIYVKSVKNEGWVCDECAWTFNPAGPPLGTSLDEMKRNFERQRNREFATHVCAQHPRPKNPKEERGSSSKPGDQP